MPTPLRKPTKVNVKVTTFQGTGQGNVRFYPGDLSAPSTGILRFTRGQTRGGSFNLPVAPTAGTLTASAWRSTGIRRRIWPASRARVLQYVYTSVNLVAPAPVFGRGNRPPSTLEGVIKMRTRAYLMAALLTTAIAVPAASAIQPPPPPPPPGVSMHHDHVTTTTHHRRHHHRRHHHRRHHHMMHHPS